jgi:hypothetical protein
MEEPNMFFQRLIKMGYNPLAQGAVFQGSSRQTQTLYQNGTVNPMPIGTLVSQGSGANVLLLDVTNEASVENFVGIVAQTTPSSASGLVVSDGRIENIPLSLGFSVGTPLWADVNSPGGLTLTKPDLTQPGWSVGDFVIFIGVVVQNQFNPSNQDIQLLRQIIGQL